MLLIIIIKEKAKWLKFMISFKIDHWRFDQWKYKFKQNLRFGNKKVIQMLIDVKKKQLTDITN